MSGLKSGANPSVFADNYNALIYIINNCIKKVNTCELVRVTAVNTAEKTLTVIPIVKNANAENDAIEESPIYGVRYFQWQYGTNGIIGTPVVGDIGMAIVCRKDISQAESGLIASFREYCLSDSIYVGGIFGLNPSPTQFIEFKDDGIDVTTPGKLTVNAKNATLNVEEATEVTTKIATITASQTVTVTATQSATITAPSINLGGDDATAGVARIGDAVNLQTGKITGGSTIVKSL